MELHISQLLIVLPLIGIGYGVWIISSAITEHFFINHNERENDHE